MLCTVPWGIWIYEQLFFFGFVFPIPLVLMMEFWTCIIGALCTIFISSYPICLTIESAASLQTTQIILTHYGQSVERVASDSDSNMLPNGAGILNFALDISFLQDGEMFHG